MRVMLVLVLIAAVGAVGYLFLRGPSQCSEANSFLLSNGASACLSFIDTIDTGSGIIRGGAGFLIETEDDVHWSEFDGLAEELCDAFRDRVIRRLRDDQYNGFVIVMQTRRPAGPAAAFVSTRNSYPNENCEVARS